MSKALAQDLPDIAFLTDYIYIDSTRVNYFLAQLFNSGVITSVKEENGYADTYSIDAGINRLIVAKKGNIMQDSSKVTKEYNSVYSLPTLLLDTLDQYGFIKSIDQSCVGNVVLVSGHYRMFDASLLEKALPIATFGGSKKKKDPTEKELKAILPLFPKNLQIDLIDDNGKQHWAALKKENLLIDIEDLFLSNGTRNADRWYLLGILENTPKIEPTEHFNDMKAEFSSVYNELKNFLGRNDESYSIKPILIFRKILK